MAFYNPSDPTQRNWMLGGVLCLIAIVPFYMYYATPRGEENDEVRERVENLTRQNTSAEAITASGGAELEERVALYARHVAQLEELIPAQEEIAILLDDIQSRARLVEVNVVSLMPEPPEPGEFYTRRAYDMAVVGEYHAVARFLTEVASLSRIVTPAQVDIELYPQEQQYPDLQSPVIASFRIETYVLPEPGSQPPSAEVGN